MSYKERLTIEYDGDFIPKELCITDKNGNIDGCDNCENKCNDTCGDCDICPIQKCFDRLGELEDKLENGTLIELPCEVGTELFLSDCINQHYRLKEYKFVGNRVVMIIECFEFQRTISRFLDEAFGVSVFLTKEEAEARLKELQNG